MQTPLRWVFSVWALTAVLTCAGAARAQMRPVPPDEGAGPSAVPPDDLPAETIDPAALGSEGAEPPATPGAGPSADAEGGFLAGPLLSALGHDRAVLSAVTRTPRLLRCEFGRLGFDWSWRETRASRVHHFALEGLFPDVGYRYRVYDGEELLAEGRFTTMPDPGSPVVATVYATPAGDEWAHRRSAAQIARQSPGARLAVRVGAPVPPGADAERWQRTFFAPAAPLCARGGFFAVPSAEEAAAPPVRALFPAWAEPGQRVAAGDLLLLMVHGAESYAPGGAAYQWLDAQLARAALPWVVVLLPRAPDLHDPHPLAQEAAAHLLPLCRARRVELVLGGGDDGYRRMIGEGPVVIALAGAPGGAADAAGGGWAAWAPAEPGVARAHRGAHFLELRTEAARLDVRALDLTGAELDRVVFEPRGVRGPARPAAPSALPLGVAPGDWPVQPRVRRRD